MSIEGRIESLKRKHRDLHERIKVFEAEKVPEQYIVSLKKEKLKIKDELMTLGYNV
jgi:hypothetical protein